MRVIGRAHTMLTTDVYERPKEPYRLEIESVDTLQPGDVMVACTNGSERTCLWGELLSTATRARGGRGVVLDGYTRDVRVIERMRFPAFATGMRPVDSKGRSTIVAIGQPVECGGVLVHPGDIVFGDVDGVVVIPKAVEGKAIRLAREKAQGETQMRAWLASGRSLREAFDHFGLL